MRWSVEVTGKAAHSSMPHLGVNAITYAGRLLGELARMEEELKALPPNPRFDPPYTSLQVTEIEGGTASNIVPVPCWFGWEIRAPAGLRRHRARPAPAHASRRSNACPRCSGWRRRPASSIEIGNEVPAFEADARSGLVPLALKLAGAERDLRRLLCHRSRPVPGRRRAVRGHRPRQHRPGPHPQRVPRASPSWKNASPSSAAWRTGRRRECWRTRSSFARRGKPTCPASPMCAWR